MQTIRGHYNGSVVVLDEPAPVDHAVEVTVGFPDTKTDEPNGNAKSGDRYHWLDARHLRAAEAIDSTDKTVARLAAAHGLKVLPYRA